MIKGVIFDMDGLMIDSETVTYQMFVKKLHKLGYDDFDEENYKAVLGKNKKGICQVFIDKYGDKFPIDDFWDESHIWIDESLRHHVPLKTGLVELLEYLKAHHYKTVVATSSERARVQEILSHGHILHYFDDMVCGDEVSKGKPDPETFLTACQKINVQPQEALVLEDSEPGILAAHQGHIDVICIPDKKYPEDFFANRTVAILESLHDVIHYLDKEKKVCAI